MPPLLGALQLVVLLLGVLLALLVGLLLGLFATLLGGASGLYPLLATLLVVSLIVGLELLLRRREARGGQGGAEALENLPESALERIENVGGEARRLARAARLGVPVPDAIVISAEVTEQWLRAPSGRSGTNLRELLPHAAGAGIEAFLYRSQGAKLALCPSFDMDDKSVTYAGLFAPVTGVEPLLDERLRAALSSVANSAQSNAAASYRRRVGTVAPVRRALVMMRKLEGEISGSAESRGVGGRADAVLIDYARPNSPPASVSYDLLQLSAQALVPDTPLLRTPTFMHRLAGLLLGLESELGGPVSVDYVVQDGQLFLTAVRHAKITPRAVWLSDGGPLRSIGGRAPRFVHDSMGGVASAVQGLSAGLAGLGKVAPEHLRDEDGVHYIDFDVLRGALGRLAMRVLLREPLWPLFALSRPISAGALPELPEITVDVAQTSRRYASYCQKHLQSLRRAHYELVLRAWLMSAVDSMLADGAQGETVPPMHRTLHKLLGRRIEKVLRAQAESARADLAGQDERLQSFVTTLVARGATDWSGMFVGDRQHYASVGELSSWAEVPQSRESIVERWDREKQSYAEREAFVTPERSFEPPLPEPSNAASSVAVVGLVPGSASGVAHSPDPRSEPSSGKIVFLPDGRSEYAAHVIAASGVVLCGGGLVSPMAALARELGVPTVACVPRKPLKSYPLGSKVSLNGDASLLRF